MMDMSMGMGLLPQQQMKASPALIALNNMLVLSTLELQQLVQNELEENPALEQMESDESLCSRCGRPLSGATCIYCLHEDMKLAEAEHTIADSLLGSLDEHGFLDGEIDEIASMMQADPVRIEMILRKLQDLG